MHNAYLPIKQDEMYVNHSIYLPKTVNFLINMLVSFYIPLCRFKNIYSKQISFTNKIPI